MFLICYIQDADDGHIYNQVWKMMEDMAESERPVSSLDGFKMVSESDVQYGFMLDHTQLEYAQIQQCEKFIIADEVFNVAGTAFPLPAGAPFINDFSYK